MPSNSIFYPMKSSYELFDSWIKRIKEGAVCFPTGDIFGGENNEMTNTMSSYIHLYKEKEEEQLGREFTEKRILFEKRGKNSGKCVIGISERGCYIQS